MEDLEKIIVFSLLTNNVIPNEEFMSILDQTKSIFSFNYKEGITKINNTYTCLVKTKKDEAYDIIIEEIDYQKFKKELLKEIETWDKEMEDI